MNKKLGRQKTRRSKKDESTENAKTIRKDKRMRPMSLKYKNYS